MIYIKELYIKNFKSIEEERIRFNKGLNVLVGPNNAGKTNIIDAIDLLLGDVYLPNFEPSTDHFFNGEENREIIIEASLEDLKGGELREINSEFKSLVTVRYKFSKQNGGSFEVKIGDQWKKQLSYYWNFDKKLFFMRVKSLRNIMEIAPIRWKSPLKYFKDKIIKKVDKEELNNIISEINKLKKKLTENEEVQKIISELEKIFKDQIYVKQVSISPSSTKHSDFLNEMKILIDDDYEAEVIKKGFGTQNLIIISLFILMAKYMSEEDKRFIIYGFDEPEIGLHPHSQRQLIFHLKKLSTYSQVIITTHSEHLIDLTQIDNVIRIGKENNKTKHYKINLTSEAKRKLEIHGRNLEEIFFAKRALIVEGDTEEGFFPEASKKVVERNGETEENYSFDYNSVSVINGGGDSIWFFAKLLKSLNIPFVMLIDDDKLYKDKNLFLKKLEENNLIKKQKADELRNIDDKEKIKEILKEYNIFVLPPFEKTISEKSNEEILKKIMKTIEFVKKHWGYEIKDMNFETNNTDLKEKVFKLLKDNKKWRIGKAIAQELEYNEIPEDYIEIIKKVSKL